MNDLINRLRDTKHHPWEICQEAADLIEQQAKMIEDLEGVRQNDATKQFHERNVL